MNDYIAGGRRVGKTAQALVTCRAEQHRGSLMGGSETEHYSWQQVWCGGPLLGALAIHFTTSNVLIR